MFRLLCTFLCVLFIRVNGLVLVWLGSFEVEIQCFRYLGECSVIQLYPHTGLCFLKFLDTKKQIIIKVHVHDQ